MANNTGAAIGAVSISAVGIQVSSGAATARVAIPNDASGGVARYVHIQATGNCYVRPGSSTVVATANDLLLSPNNYVRLCVAGCTHIAYIQETSAQKINITPVEAG